MTRPDRQGVRSACLFCGSVSSKLTKEHVFRRDFKQHFAVAPGITFTHRGDDLRETVRRPISQFDMTVRIVCNHCNQGWLNDLENRVWPTIAVLTGLTADRSLSVEELEVLGYWVYVRALVRTHVSPQGKAPERLFGDAYRAKAVPTGARVQAALCTHSILEAGSHLSCRVTSSTDHDVWQVSFGLAGVLFTATFVNPDCGEGGGLAEKVAEGPPRWFPNAFLSLAPVRSAQDLTRILSPDEAIVSASALSLAVGQPRCMDQMGTIVDHLAVIPAQFHASLVL